MHETHAASDYEDILRTISEELQRANVGGIEMTAETDITTDLNVDSVAVMDLMFVLEERYDISVPLNELGEVRTIGELARLVQQIVARG